MLVRDGVPSCTWVDVFCGQWGDKCPSPGQPLTLSLEIASYPGLGNWEEENTESSPERERENARFGVLEEDPRQEVVWFQNFPAGVRGIVKQHTIPLMFSAGGKPCTASVHARTDPECSSSLFFPSPASLTTSTTDPEPQGHKEGGNRAFSTEGPHICLAEDGRSWPRFPAFVLGEGCLLFI